MPLLDYLTTQFIERFYSTSVTTCSGLVIIPSKMTSMVHEKVGQREKFGPFAEFNTSDIPCYKALDVEVDFQDTYWLNNTSYQLVNDFSSFSNIKICLRILKNLPVTICTCERSFFSMRRLKNYTRNPMVSERLNGTALCT